MHEMSVAAGILSAAKGVSGGKRIAAVNIVLGELAGIEEESLRLCWELVTRDTCCSDSRLNIKYIYADLICQKCGNCFPLRENRSLLCPQCGGEGRLRERANEQYIESVEINDGKES